MIYNFISSILFTLIIPGILLGILLTFISIFIASLNPYKYILQIIGTSLIIFFALQYGREYEIDKYTKTEAKYKLEIAELAVKSANITTNTVIEYVDRIKIVDRIKEVPINVYINSTDDKMCNISTATSGNIIRLLNSASQGKLPGATGNTNVTTR